MGRRLGRGALVVAALALGLPAPAARAASVVQVRVGPHEEFTRVVFELDAPSRYRIERNTARDGSGRITVSLDAVSAPRSIRSRSDLIERVSVEPGPDGRAVAQIHLNDGTLRLREMILTKPPRIVLDVMAPEKVAATAPAPPAAKPRRARKPAEVTPAPAPRAAPKPAPPAVPEPEPVAVVEPPKRAEPPAPKPAPPAVVVPEPEKVAAVEPPKRAALPEPTPRPEPAPEAVAGTEPTLGEQPAVEVEDVAEALLRETLEEVDATARATPEAEPEPIVQVPPGEPEAPGLAPTPPAPVPDAPSGGLPLGITPLRAGIAFTLILVAAVVWLMRRRRSLPGDLDVSMLDDDEIGAPGEESLTESLGFNVKPEDAEADGGLRGEGVGSAAEQPEPGLYGGFDATEAEGMETDTSLRLDSPGAGMGGEDMDGELARLVRELDGRVSQLEARLEEANEARERLERQVAAQSEELRVQRAAIARTQRAVRGMSRGEEEATEPALRDPSKSASPRP